MSEATIQDSIRLAAPSLGLVIWRNNVGIAEHGRSRVRYGLAPGSSDLIGIRQSDGRFVAIEVKSERGKVTDAQAAFLACVERAGGIAIVARSVEDVREALRRGLRHRLARRPDEPEMAKAQHFESLKSYKRS